MHSFDVIVVGGGPAGAVTARVAAEAGARVLVLEQRGKIEEPSACAGLVSPRTLSVLGASDACVVRRVRDVSFHAPGGGRLSVRATSDRAFVVDRSVLECELLARAQEAGAEVLLGAAAVSWSDGTVSFASPAGRERARGRVLVGADGPESRVAAWLGLQRTAKRLRAAQAEIISSDQSGVGVYVGRQVAPGFFAWSIPAQAGRLRVGVAVPAPVNPIPYLERLLTTRFPDNEVVTRVEGVIPLPTLDAPTTRGDGLLVGDAAGHVKPLSGGGLYFGGLCARIAGRAAAAACSPEARVEQLRRYEAGCRNLIGPETRFGNNARVLYGMLEDVDWDALLALLDRRELVEVVERHVDIDHLRFLAGRVLSRPGLWQPLFDAWALARRRVRTQNGVADPGSGLL